MLLERGEFFWGGEDVRRADDERVASNVVLTADEGRRKILGTRCETALITTARARKSAGGNLSAFWRGSHLKRRHQASDLPAARGSPSRSLAVAHSRSRSSRRSFRLAPPSIAMSGKRSAAEAPADEPEAKAQKTEEEAAKAEEAEAADHDAAEAGRTRTTPRPRAEARARGTPRARLASRTSPPPRPRAAPRPRRRR